MDGEQHSKASSADHGTKVAKVAIIQNNRDKYSVSAMCDVLQIARSTFYYEAKEQSKEDQLVVCALIEHSNFKDIPRLHAASPKHTLLINLSSWIIVDD